jgi:exopolyphosphatase/pppGpp-phosphohydrolase
VLTAANLDRLRTLLATTPSAELARIHALDPARARVLAGGVEIVEAIRAHYAAESVQTTIHGLRTGMILAFLENGDRWVDG